MVAAANCLNLEFYSCTAVRSCTGSLYILNLTYNTVFLGGSKFYSSGLDLSTLEVHSVRRSHSGLSGTGRGSS